MRLAIRPAGRVVGAAPAVADAVGEEIAIAVADSGTGIPDDVRAHLFEPFFTTKPRGQGTGLGLSMVRDLVERNGGRVLVDSELGRGSTFTVSFARAVAPETSARRPPEPNAVTRGSESILLVEDSPLVRDLAREVLDWLGYRVQACATAEEALEVAGRSEGPIDLLLTDVILPRMDGCELAERLAATRPRVHVLFTSGFTDDVVSRPAARLPRHLFLAKPYTPQSLAARIREALALG